MPERKEECCDALPKPNQYCVASGSVARACHFPSLPLSALPTTARRQRKTPPSSTPSSCLTSSRTASRWTPRPCTAPCWWVMDAMAWHCTLPRAREMDNRTHAREAAWLCMVKLWLAHLHCTAAACGGLGGVCLCTCAHAWRRSALHPSVGRRPAPACWQAWHVTTCQASLQMSLLACISGAAAEPRRCLRFSSKQSAPALISHARCFTLPPTPPFLPLQYAKLCYPIAYRVIYDSIVPDEIGAHLRCAQALRSSFLLLSPTSLGAWQPPCMHA